MTRYTLKAGDLAYILPVMGGLVPCKVVTIFRDRDASSVLTRVEITADRARLGYRRGETFDFTHAHLGLANRKQIFIRCGQYRVRGALELIQDPREN